MNLQYIQELQSSAQRSKHLGKSIRTSYGPDDVRVAEAGKSYLDILHAVNRLCNHYTSLNLSIPRTVTPPEQVIAVLTSTAIDESILEIALAKLGLTSLLLSINNSVPAIAHLCKQTRATHLIYGVKYRQHAEDARASLKAEGIDLQIVPETRFPLWGKGGVRDVPIPQFKAVLSPEEESTRTCVILHSSGSTGFPKPVYITHYGLLANCAQSIPKTGFSALPLFHGFGHFSM
jgi:acyl-coenzyme A synthetase/AMP-(fatty) acid ligase